MNKSEALAKLTELANSNVDPEGDHHRADNVLCEFLREIGHGDLADQFNKIYKWYS